MVVVAAAIAAAATGAAILVVTMLRVRRLRRYREFLRYMEDNFDVSDLDLSGETAYTDCLAQEWVLDNVARGSYGRFARGVQSYLAENTLAGAILLAIVAGSAAVLLGLLFVEGSAALGAAAGLFFIGGLVIVGPSEPRVSEQLLTALMSNKDRLCERDYVYARLAYDSVRGWERTSTVAGLALLAISPWADLVPTTLAAIIAIVSVGMIIRPAMWIATFNPALAIGYVGVVVVIVFYLIPKTMWRLIKGPPSEEERELESMSRW